MLRKSLRLQMLESIKSAPSKNRDLTRSSDSCSNPIVSGILIMILVGGIYFELQSPGIGFPLGAAVVAAILYFAPLYLEGLAENWEIVIFIIGLLLIAVEIFAIPGFGVAGILGIILVVAGLTLAMVDNIVFELEWNIAFSEVIKRFFIVISSMFLSLILSLFLGKQLFTNKAFAGTGTGSEPGYGRRIPGRGKPSEGTGGQDRHC